MGMTIAGIAATTVGALFVMEGMDQHERAQRVAANGFSNDRDFSPIFYVMGGLHLAVGIPLLAVGLIDRKDVYVRDEVALAIAPQVGRGFAGGALRVAF